MKKILLSAFSLFVMMTASQAQTVFSSDLSNWDGGAPTDFMGVKTNIQSSAVTEVTEGSVYGSSNVRLENATSTHKRFTTQAVSVEEGQGYEIKFWAKGQGDVRTGLFDDHAPIGNDGGFVAYNNYITVNTSTLTEYSQTVSSTHTSDAGEFVFSLRNTVAPNHLEIDSVSITAVVITPPEPVSIYDIQFTTDPSGDSPLKDQVVYTGGIVTAVRSDNRYWIKSGNGPWTGVYVYHQPATPVALGDSVTFSATVTEYNGLTELSFINNFEVVSNGNFFMANQVTSAQANSEAYEGCLVRVNNANCTAAPNQYNEWTINDGSGPVMVDDFLYNYTPTVGAVYMVTGIVDYFQNFKILPRNGNDVSVATSIDESEIMHVSIYPNPAQDVLNIQFATDAPQELIITDASGRVVEKILSTGNTKWDVAQLPSGVYFVNLGGAAHRFVKQ